jgi:hypothetical protein
VVQRRHYFCLPCHAMNIYTSVLTVQFHGCRCLLATP